MAKLRYTVNGKYDKEIQEYIDTAIEEIRKEIKEVKAVIIYGGYGRGEGSVKISKGKVFPVNDFDTYVITEKKVEDEKLDNIAKNFAKRLGIKGIPFKTFDKTWNFEESFYLDLKCLTLKELKRLFPMIRYYELRESNVVYGDEKVKELIPRYSVKDIPLSEGARILMNRMTHLVEYFSLEDKYDETTLAFFCSKVYIDGCTALSLLNGRYSASYRKRMEGFVKNFRKDFPELYDKVPDLDKKVKKYTEWKLNEIKGLPEKDVKKFWLQARKDGLEICKYFFSRYLNKKIDNLDDLNNAISNMGRIYYRSYADYWSKYNLGFVNPLASEFLMLGINVYFKLIYFIRIFENKRPYFRMFFNLPAPDLLIMGAMSYILFGIDDNLNINMEKFVKGLDSLKRVYPAKAYNWEQLSQEFADAYILFYLQKIV